VGQQVVIHKNYRHLKPYPGVREKPWQTDVVNRKKLGIALVCSPKRKKKQIYPSRKRRRAEKWISPCSV
jgi:hypothetical protein